MAETGSPADASGPRHVPVLVGDVLDALLPVAREWIVDCTLGLGGHAAALLERTPPAVRLIGLDADAGNLSVAGKRLSVFGDRVRLIVANFADLSAVLESIGIRAVDAILADLGLSSNQLADAARGFSFERDGPLDMRLDPSRGPTAADLLATLGEAELADLLYVQSQEARSRRIARAICAARRTGRINSTAMLARLVSDAVGARGGRSRIHPATRTFMALRIAVNREPESLAALLRQAPDVLRIGGRLAIISFHSGEDRLVKEDFRRRSRAGEYAVLTKRPVTAGRAEQRINPRSRSAKLRVAERIQANCAGRLAASCAPAAGR